MASFEHGDDGVVVIIGSGAGGGTLAHELTRSGVKVVLLEAGKRESIATFSQDPGVAFGQLTWLDPRTQSGTWGVPRDFPTLPAWIAKTVGGTTVHWTAATPRNRDWEVTARTSYGNIPGASLIMHNGLNTNHQRPNQHLSALAITCHTTSNSPNFVMCFINASWMGRWPAFAPE